MSKTSGSDDRGSNSDWVSRPAWPLKLKRDRFVRIGALILFGLVMSSHSMLAALYIDTFGIGAKVVGLDAIPKYNSENIAAEGGISSRRNTTLNSAVNTTDINYSGNSVSVNAGSGSTFSGGFVWDNKTITPPTDPSTIDYSGLYSSPGVGVNLLANGLDRILVPAYVDSAAHPVSLTLTIYRYGGAGDYKAEKTITNIKNTTPFQDYVFQYSSFSLFGTVTPTMESIIGNVGAIQLTWNAPSADTDLVLGSITAVPEVGTVWPLAAVAGLAIGCRQWRSRRQKSSGSTAA